MCALCWSFTNIILRCMVSKTTKFLSNVTYSLGHRQAGAPVVDIQSTNRSALSLCINASLQCYLAAKVIHLQSLRIQTCVCLYIHIFFTI